MFAVCQLSLNNNIIFQDEIGDVYKKLKLVQETLQKFNFSCQRLVSKNSTSELCIHFNGFFGVFEEWNRINYNNSSNTGLSGNGAPLLGFHPVMLYAALPLEHQKEAFASPPPGCRKVRHPDRPAMPFRRKMVLNCKCVLFCAMSRSSWQRILQKRPSRFLGLCTSWILAE